MKFILEALDKESIFSKEIGCIETPICHEIAKVCVENAPEYFWVIPASSTGKYHPKSSLGIGGLVRHTKSVLEIAEIYLGHPQNNDLSPESKDEIRVACLIHDMVKLGDNPSGYTIHEHPMLVRTMLCPYDTEDEDIPKEIIDTWDRICNLVESHMGVWNTNKNSDVVLPVPETREQNIVHMSDYMASRKNISVDMNMETPKTDATPKTDNLKATEKQMQYIEGLLQKCQLFNTPIPAKLQGTELRDKSGNIVLAREKASEVIQTLKDLVYKNS